MAVMTVEQSEWEKMEQRIAKLEGEVTHQREKYGALMRKANEFTEQNTALQATNTKLVLEKRELVAKVDEVSNLNEYSNTVRHYQIRVDELKQKLAEAVEIVAVYILAVTAAYDQGWDEAVEAAAKTVDKSTYSGALPALKKLMGQDISRLLKKGQGV